MKTFDEVFENTDKIYGAFTVNEAKRLWELATSVPDGGVVVEVGSYCGRSSSILAQVQEEKRYGLYLVDNFITGAPGVDNVKNLLIENLKWGEYTLLDGDSAKLGKKFKKDIDLLFIDGDHAYEGIRKDIDVWAKKAKIVAFHDYGSSWDGVKKAIDETEYLQKVSIADTLIVTKVL